jgi:hypothetical protein
MYQIHLTTILLFVIIFQLKTNDAQIIVTDISGQTLKSIEVNTKSSGQVTITAGTLSAGNYIYSLVVDGKKVDSKQMMNTK